MGPSLIHGHMCKVQSGRQRDRRSIHSVLAPSSQPLLHLLTLCAEDLGAALLVGVLNYCHGRPHHSNLQSADSKEVSSGPLQGPGHELSGQTDDQEEGMGTHLHWAAGPVNLTLPTPGGGLHEVLQAPCSVTSMAPHHVPQEDLLVLEFWEPGRIRERSLGQRPCIRGGSRCGRLVNMTILCEVGFPSVPASTLSGVSRVQDGVQPRWLALTHMGWM